ncbi:hypothetical protein GGX14DRAFT_659779 [Mycena pura]|uniref:Uncharacterized protein n=1 Tax=Mycena pura TaxID=153505 RepID=A0AAD6V1R2_9AGAR|nr:hypothetical protein GGX14DRAFT_659779 [Mycena pura]
MIMSEVFITRSSSSRGSVNQEAGGVVGSGVTAHMPVVSYSTLLVAPLKSCRGVRRYIVEGSGLSRSETWTQPPSGGLISAGSAFLLSLGPCIKSMAALYLHNSIWVPDSESGEPPTSRPPSSATLQTLQLSEHSHPTQPLLYSATSESVAYLDLLARQPAHPNERSPGHGSGPPAGLTLDGDPATQRDRKEILEQAVRRRLRRLKVMMAVLELIMGCWAVYTMVRYFLAYAVVQSRAGQKAALALAVVSIASLAALLAAASVPILQLCLLRQNVSITALLTVRFVLRCILSLLLLAPAVANTVLVFVWRSASSAALDTAPRCLDVDVVWALRAHATCLLPEWAQWLALALVRVLITLLILTTYHLVLAAYDRTRRPSRHAHSASISESTTFIGSSPTLQRGARPMASRSSSTLDAAARLTPAPERRSLRRSRSRGSGSGSGSVRRYSASPNGLPSPRASNDAIGIGADADDFDPYAELSGVQPDGDGYHELSGFVERFRALLSQASESDAFLGASSSEAAYLAAAAAAAAGRDEFGRPYPYAHPHAHPHAHAFARPDGGRVRILNAYIRRMPTIESLGSRERAGTASASVAGSSVAGEHRAASASGASGASASASTSTSATGHTLVRAQTLGALAAEARSEPPSRAGSLLCAAGSAEGGEREPCDRERALRRAGSVGSSASASYLSGSPMHSPIAEEPPCADEDVCQPPPPPPPPLGSSILGLPMPMPAPLRRHRADSPSALGPSLPHLPGVHRTDPVVDLSILSKHGLALAVYYTYYFCTRIIPFYEISRSPGRVAKRYRGGGTIFFGPQTLCTGRRKVRVVLDEQGGQERRGPNQLHPWRGGRRDDRREETRGVRPAMLQFSARFWRAGAASGQHTHPLATRTTHFPAPSLRAGSGAAQRTSMGPPDAVSPKDCARDSWRAWRKASSSADGDVRRRMYW